tara:strand:+ start:1780 stop:1947 length:168 start_codon:yes stop_codon:yes gene_type:complete
MRLLPLALYGELTVANNQDAAVLALIIFPETNPSAHWLPSATAQLPLFCLECSFD